MVVPDRVSRRTVGVLLMIVSLLILSSCAPGPSKPPRSLKKLIIAEGTFSASAPIYVARDKGFFEQEGLDAVISRYDSGRLALEATLEGKADIGTAAVTPIARAVLDRKRPVLVATICEIDGAVVIIARKDRGISTAEDLRGKRVGMLPGTSTEFFLHLYLVTAGVDPKAVTVVPLVPNDFVSALADGRIDAVSSFEPHTAELVRRLGSNALVLDPPGLYRSAWNVVASEESARDDQDVIVRFLRAIARANDFIASNPAEAQAITSKGTGIPVGGLREVWDDHTWTLALDQTLILALEDEARWMSAGEGVPPNFLQHVDIAPLRKVRPDSVRIVQPKD